MQTWEEHANFAQKGSGTREQFAEVSALLIHFLLL